MTDMSPQNVPDGLVALQRAVYAARAATRAASDADRDDRRRDEVAAVLALHQARAAHRAETGAPVDWVALRAAALGDDTGPGERG